MPVTGNAANIHKLTGGVFVNGKRISAKYTILAGDRVTVSRGSKLALKLGEDAFLVRGGNSIELDSLDGFVIRGLRLLTGGLLSVFGKANKKIITHRATIGIRGTALYLEDSPYKTYFCTCYGETELITKDHCIPVSATHHNAHFITADKQGTKITPEPKVIGHTDDELRMLEALVGRVPTFDR